MGVVYKLTQDVIEYIIRQKQTTPALGCRDLAKIVSQKFSIAVSKSSVNAVLRNNRLSSPVGRRLIGAKKAGRRKFEIPSERRQQIGLSMAPGGGTPGPAKETAASTKKPSLGQQANTFSAAIQCTRPSKKERVYHNAGLLFLWATLRLAANKSLAEIFFSNLQGIPFQEALPLWEASVLCQASGKNLEEILASPEGSFISKICGLNRISDPLEKYRLFYGQKISEELSLKIAVEIPSRFTLIKTIKISFEDGREIRLNSNLSNMLFGNVQSDKYALLENSLERISSQLINNVQSVKLISTPLFDKHDGSGIALEDFWSFLSAFENLSGKRIVKIKIFDSKNQELVVFDTIPQRRRYFLAGIWPGQIKFSDLKSRFCTSNLSHDLKITAHGQEYWIKEAEFLFTKEERSTSPVSGRVFFIRTQKGGDSQLAIVTNAPANVLSAQKSAQEYLLRWPDLEYGNKIIQVNPPGMTKEKTDVLAGADEEIDINQCISNIYSFNDLDANFAKMMLFFCRKLFFYAQGEYLISEEMLKILFNLTAKIEENKDYLKVTLNLTPGKPFLDRTILEQALFLLKEAEIKDNFGKDLLLFIA